MPKAITRADVLLAALSHAPGHTLTPVQVQKAMFLVSQEAKKVAPRDFYTFEKYNYGPFNSAIYQDLESLAQNGLIVIDRPPDTRVRCYRLTRAGTTAAKASTQAMNPKLRQYLGTLVRWVTSLSFQDLVRAIYQKYPAYKVNSVFSD